MKKSKTFLLFILLSGMIHAQINMNDSTAQVIGYWDKNEKQTYTVTQLKYKIQNSDTTSRESFKYEVDITIVDSTENSYTIDWLYRNYQFDSGSDLINKLASIAENITIRIKTDELGAFQEVLNWKEVRDQIRKGTRMLMNETKEIPNMENFIKQLEGMYDTKESVEAGAIKEIQQFYTFHGGKYELNKEYSGEIKVANLLGGEPFDANVTVRLDEINPDKNNFVLRSKQTVNSEQLRKATYEFLAKTSESLKVPGPENEEITDITNNIWVSSRIHGSGWIIYSIEEKETKANEAINIEERIIEIN